MSDEMSNGKTEYFTGGVMVGLLLCWLILWMAEPRKRFEHNAIKAGVAEYRINPETFKKEFHFLNPK